MSGDVHYPSQFANPMPDVDLAPILEDSALLTFMQNVGARTDYLSRRGKSIAWSCSFPVMGFRCIDRVIRHGPTLREAIASARKAWVAGLKA